MALENSSEASPSVRAKGLNSLGSQLSLQSDFSAAHRALQESLTIRKELGVRLDIAATFNQLGNLATYEKDYA